jgi:L-galactose dehydrogenase/L-glyceraldehyde 3-phosphate reductase
MNRRPLGRTGLDISELVIGGGFVGGILLQEDLENRLALYDRALAAGINWIDTAPSYGDGRSEDSIGELLALRPKEGHPHISTKVRLNSDDLVDVRGALERSLVGSLTRLGVDRVDLFQLHNPIGAGGLDLDAVLGSGGVADGFDWLRDKSGLFGHAGFTAVGQPKDCRTIIELGRFATAQIYYNLINPSAGYAVPAGWTSTDFGGLIGAAAKSGMGVMNIRIFAAGVLATTVRHGREIPITIDSAAPAEEARAARVWAALGDGHGTPAQAALRFGLANPDVSCIVIGLAEMAHLEEALAGHALGPLPGGAIAALGPVWEKDVH